MHTQYIKLSYSGQKVGTFEIVFDTKHDARAEEFARLLAETRTILPKSKLRKVVNSRAVECILIENQWVAAICKDEGRLADIPQVGTKWASIEACALALGISAQGLRQTFSKARKAADGFDVPIVTKGIKLQLEKKFNE
jgi:hypothetical protein